MRVSTCRLNHVCFVQQAKQIGESPSKNKHKKTPRVGLEPTTYRLTAGCSTIELSRNIFFYYTKDKFFVKYFICSTLTALSNSQTRCVLRITLQNSLYQRACHLLCRPICRRILGLTIYVRLQ